MRTVSTIIPVYNRAAMLREAVDSVLAQTWRPIEIIIVDDGSTDDTSSVADELSELYSPIIRVVRQENAGPGVARNTGLQLATGDFIQYLDSDDLLEPRKFEIQVQALDRNLDAGVCYCVTLRHNENAGGMRPWANTVDRIEKIFPEFLPKRGWATLTPLWRRSACDQIGPWSDFRVLEDWEHDLRAGMLGIRPVQVKETLCTVRDHGGNRASGMTTGYTPQLLRDVFRAHQEVWRQMRERRLTDWAYLEDFGKKLFLLARMCGEKALVSEANQSLKYAEEIYDFRSRPLQLRLFRPLLRIAGWKTSVKISEFSHSVCKSINESSHRAYIGNTTLRSRMHCSLRERTGFQRLAEHRAQGALVVLYHGILERVNNPRLTPYCIDRATFRQHLKYFRQAGEIVPLKWIVDTVRHRKPMPSNWIAITFDDALQCQIDIAGEELDAARCPWSIAVPAGLVGTGRSLWTNELRMIVLNHWRKTTLPHPIASQHGIPSNSKHQRCLALRQIEQCLRDEHNPDQRQTYLERLIDETGREEFLQALQTIPRYLRLANWDDLRKLSWAGVEFLAHGKFHRAQFPGLDDRTQRDEIFGSRQLIIEHLGKTPCGFALPYGQRNEQTTALIQEAGFEYCLGSAGLRVTSDTDVFAIERFNAEYPLTVLRRHLLRCRGQ